VQVVAKAFWLPKAGNTEAEYEDAFLPRHPEQRRLRSFRCAVADGATETSFSGMWAKQLVRAFCSCTPDALILTALPALQQRWLTTVQRRPLPWYAEEKVRSGAFAALLGLVLVDSTEPGGPGQWRATALGDSCLVHMRNETILARFPVQDAASFTNQPHLLSSNPSYNERAAKHLVTTGDGWCSGDTFYLMTDALAHWFLSEAEAGRQPWAVLRDLDTKDQSKPFADFVADLRQTKSMRNDDVTLLRVEVWADGN